MAQEEQFSAFYPTSFYPEHEQAARQGEMAGQLQTIVRELSRIGPNQPHPQAQTQIVQIQKQDSDAAYQMGILANDLRERLGEGMIGLRESLSDLSSQIEWGFESLNDSITQQTSVLLTIAKQQTRRAELDASEHLANARGMVNQLRDNINSGRLDESDNNSLFEAADKRFKLAAKKDPSSGLMYAILLGRAELHILAKKNVEALAILEENLIYAPKDETFDSCSYLYRLMGRIVFTLDKWCSRSKAETYLGKAIHLSPGYAIAWYDRAQYLATLAPLTGAESAVSCLRHAIEMNEGFMLLAIMEPNFNPIRNEVETLISTIQQEKADELKRRADEEAEVLRRDCIARCDKLIPVFEEITRLYHNFWQIKKLADEAVDIPFQNFREDVRYSAESKSRLEAVVFRETDRNREKITNLRNRVLTTESHPALASFNSDISILELGWSSDLFTLQEHWKFWQDLVRDIKRTAESCSWNIAHLQSVIAEWKQELARHDSQKPRQSRNAQKHTGLTRLGIENLAKQYKGGLYLPWQEYYIITHEVEEELLAELSWREFRQKILHKIRPAEESIESFRNRVTWANQFLEEFQQLSRA